MKPKRPISPPFIFKIVRLNPTKVKLKVFTRTGELVGTNSFPDEAAAIKGFQTGDYYAIVQPF